MVYFLERHTAPATLADPVTMEFDGVQIPVPRNWLYLRDVVDAADVAAREQYIRVYGTNAGAPSAWRTRVAMGFPINIRDLGISEIRCPGMSDITL